MSLTRKDYVMLAEVIDGCEGYKVATIELISRRKLADELADKLAADNPRFDKVRFLKACGVT